MISITSLEIAEAVRVLTKENGYNMEIYIENIKNNELALPVKLADRIHNLSETFLADDKFKKRYIEETQQYYIPLSGVRYLKVT